MKMKYLALALVVFGCDQGIKAPKPEPTPVPNEDSVPKTDSEKQTGPLSETPRGETPEERFERIKAYSKNICTLAREGLKKHGGQILFNNLGDKCYMMSALQIFFHSKPVFEAFCNLDASKISVKDKEAGSFLYGALTANLYLLFQYAFDPNRDASKMFDAKDEALAICTILEKEATEKYREELAKGLNPLEPINWCHGYQDAANFLSTVTSLLKKENAGFDAMNTFAIKYNDGNILYVPYLAQGGKTIVQKLENHFKRLPPDEKAAPPKVLFVRSGRSEDPAKGLNGLLDIPGLGQYYLTGAALVKGNHYTSRVKNLVTKQWQKFDSLGSTVVDTTLKDVINDISAPGTDTTLIALEKAE